MYELWTCIEKNPSNILEIVEKNTQGTPQIHNPITFEKNYEGDHAIRTNSRCGLNERLYTTVIDKDDCVLVPKVFHTLKEQMDYSEPKGFNYKDGIKNVLFAWRDQQYAALDFCTNQELGGVSKDIYKEAYHNCFQAKLEELELNYPKGSPSDLHMIYHAKLAGVSNQAILLKFVESQLPIRASLDKKTLTSVQLSNEDPGPSNPVPSSVLLKNTPVGDKLQQVQNTSLNAVLETVNQRTLFINTISKIASKEALPFIDHIQKLNRTYVQVYLLELTPRYGALTESQLDNLSSTDTLIEVLQELNPNIPLDEAVYEYANTRLELTTAGVAIRSPISCVTLETIEEKLDNSSIVNDPGVYRKLQEGQNDKIIAAGLKGFPKTSFVSTEVSDFYTRLTSEDIKMTKTLALNLVNNCNISNYEDLTAKCQNGSSGLSCQSGVGEKKINQVVNALKVLEAESDNSSVSSTISFYRPSSQTTLEARPSVIEESSDKQNLTLTEDEEIVHQLVKGVIEKIVKSEQSSL